MTDRKQERAGSPTGVASETVFMWDMVKDLREALKCSPDASPDKEGVLDTLASIKSNADGKITKEGVEKVILQLKSYIKAMLDYLDEEQIKGSKDEKVLSNLDGSLDAIKRTLEMPGFVNLLAASEALSMSEVVKPPEVVQPPAAAPASWQKNKEKLADKTLMTCQIVEALKQILSSPPAVPSEEEEVKSFWFVLNLLVDETTKTFTKKSIDIFIKDLKDSVSELIQHPGRSIPFSRRKDNIPVLVLQKNALMGMETQFEREHETVLKALDSLISDDNTRPDDDIPTTTI